MPKERVWTVSVTSDDLQLVEHLTKAPPEKLVVLEAAKVPGAQKSMAMVRAQAIGIPASVLASLLASWIWTASQKEPQAPARASIVIVEGERRVEIKVDGLDQQSLHDVLSQAVEDEDPAS